MRLIDADAIPYWVNPVTGLDSPLDTVRRKDVDKMSTIDAEKVKFGYWTKKIVTDDPLDKIGLFRRRWYCSDCGARMCGVENE